MQHRAMRHAAAGTENVAHLAAVVLIGIVLIFYLNAHVYAQLLERFPVCSNFTSIFFLDWSAYDRDLLWNVEASTVGFLQ